MKSIIAVLALTVLFSFKANDEKQMLTVKYSVEDWQQKLNILEWTKQVLKNSNVPANVFVSVSDSLTKFQSEIMQQVQLQIKPDSTKKK